MVSSNAPTHARPSFSGCCTMVRERLRCDCDWKGGHWLHSLHALNSQSFGLSHSTEHCLVECKGPAHGSPHSLFVTSMVRRRSQSPSQVGSPHSPQVLNAQFLGSHVLHPEDADAHKLTFNCVPAHSDSPTTLKRNCPIPGSLVVKPKALLRIVVAGPQDSQAVEPDH